MRTEIKQGLCTAIERARRLLLLLLPCGAAMVSPRLPAAVPTEEEIAYNAAARFFQDKAYDRAATELDSYVKRFPASDRVPDALLAEAQARFELRQYDNVISLMSTNFNRASKRDDYFRFWIAESYYRKADYPAAATNYHRLLQDYPTTFLQAQASYSEAMAWFQAGNVTNAIEHLRQPGTPFQKAASAQTNDLFVLRGYLLLGEALLQQKEYRPAEEALNVIADRSLPPELAWQRQYLLARVQLADQRAPDVLKNLTNLLTVATNTGSAKNLALSLLFQGQALQAAQQLPAAIEVYNRSLPSLPPEERHQALLKLVELSLSLTNSAGAIKHLESFIAQFPKDPATDQALLSLGELRLKDYRALRESAGKTNQQRLAASGMALQQALTNLNLLITSTNFANSPLLGQAKLDLGWYYWEADDVPGSLLAFKGAAELLPPSTNQALARFKWAECQFRQKDYSNCLQNCRAIVSQYGADAGFPKPLLERTLYEIIRASTSLVPGNLTEATAAMERILADFPHGEFVDRSLLLVGQLLIRLDKPKEARARFERLLKDVPHSALIPEAQLAIARTYAKERNWPLAISQYNEWVGRYTNHEDLDKVQFDRAWANDQGGNETNALHLFTNFVSRFPQSPLWPLAQYWVGDYYYNLGRLGDQTNFGEAEQNYQRLYGNTNWATSELAYQARLAAGRAAFAGQRLNNAIPDFRDLINLLLKQTNSAPGLLSEAWIALGDTYRSKASADLTNLLSNLGDAITAYSRVPSGDRLKPRALALIADCHLQLAKNDPSRYASAASNYLSVVTVSTNSAHADVEARSNAEVGLGFVREKQAEGKSGAEKAVLLQQAWDHYANVAYRRNLLPGEKPDPFWIAKAGLEAARLLEDQKKWGQAIALYQRLLAELPSSLTGRLKKKLDQAKEHLQ